MAAMENHEDPASLAAWALENLYGRIAPRVFGHAARMLDGEVTFSRVMALFHLYRLGPQSIADLAVVAFLSPTAASRMVDGLVAGGLVSRRESPVDRRRKVVALTAEGGAVIKGLRAETAAAFLEVLGAAPPEMTADLAGAVTRVVQALPDILAD
jgi:DNA-binding MarR family transcriptional regulator